MTKGERTRKGHIKGLLKVSGSCTFEYRRTVWLAYAGDEDAAPRRIEPGALSMFDKSRRPGAHVLDHQLIFGAGGLISNRSAAGPDPVTLAAHAPSSALCVGCA
jgi:hypothetical protein